MAVNFSVKQVPEGIARRLRERARRHHRSLQQELLCILEAAVADAAPPAQVAEPAPPTYASRPRRAQPDAATARLTLAQAWDRARRLGGPVVGESSQSVIRRDRDERSRR